MSRVDRCTPGRSGRRILKLAVSEVEPQREGPTLPAIAGVARLGDTLVQLVDIDRMLRTDQGWLK